MARQLIDSSSPSMVILVVISSIALVSLSILVTTICVCCVRRRIKRKGLSAQRKTTSETEFPESYEINSKKNKDDIVGSSGKKSSPPKRIYAGHVPTDRKPEKWHSNRQHSDGRQGSGDQAISRTVSITKNPSAINSVTAIEKSIVTRKSDKKKIATNSIELFTAREKSNVDNNSKSRVMIKQASGSSSAGASLSTLSRSRRGDQQFGGSTGSTIKSAPLSIKSTPVRSTTVVTSIEAAGKKSRSVLVKSDEKEKTIGTRRGFNEESFQRMKSVMKSVVKSPPPEHASTPKHSTERVIKVITLPIIDSAMLSTSKAA